MNVTRRVLVLGAQGVLGAALARDFEAAGWDVRRAARRPEAGFQRVDLERPETLAAAFADADVIVNPVPHPGLTAERRVLEAGGLLVNVSALPDARVRELRGGASGARGLVVMNAGRTPGVSNLVAADLLAAHPDADAVELAFTLSASGSAGTAAGEFMHRNVRTVSRHGTAVIPLPAPFGTRQCLEFAEPERGWLGGLAEGRAVRTYVCFLQRGLDRTLRALNRVGALSRLPRAAFVPRGKVDPGAPGEDPVREWVAVLRGGRRLAARTIEGEGGYPVTAACTRAYVEALLDREDRPTFGCFDPHEPLALDALAPRLEAAGVRVVTRPVRDGAAGA